MQKKRLLNQLNVLGMSEMGWEGRKELIHGDYTLYFSAEKKSGSNGMGIMRGSQLKDKVAKLKYRFRSQSCHCRGKCEVKKVKNS